MKQTLDIKNFQGKMECKYIKTQLREFLRLQKINEALDSGDMVSLEEEKIKILTRCITSKLESM